MHVDVRWVVMSPVLLTRLISHRRALMRWDVSGLIDWSYRLIGSVDVVGLESCCVVRMVDLLGEEFGSWRSVLDSANWGLPLTNEVQASEASSDGWGVRAERIDLCIVRYEGMSEWYLRWRLMVVWLGGLGRKGLVTRLRWPVDPGCSIFITEE